MNAPSANPPNRRPHDAALAKPNRARIATNARIIQSAGSRVMFYRSALENSTGPIATGSQGRQALWTTAMSGAAFVSSLQDDAQRVRRRRARAVIALAATAFAAGAIVGAEHSSSSAAGELAAGFVAAWARGDYATMYADISPASQREVSVGEFANAYQAGGMLATASGLRAAGRPYPAAGGVEVVPVQVRTRLFGTLSSSFRLPISGQGEAGDRVRWSGSLAFPDCGRGAAEQEHRLAPTASLLARDGRCWPAWRPRRDSGTLPRGCRRSRGGGLGGADPGRSPGGAGVRGSACGRDRRGLRPELGR